VGAAQDRLPVHGEVRHMVEHAALARQCQVPETVVAPNGTLVRLAPGPADDHRPCPCWPAGARRRWRRSAGGLALRERRKLLWNGAAAPPGDRQQGRPKAAPVVSLRGMEDEDGDLATPIVAGLKEMLADLSAAERRDDGRIEDAAHKACAASCARTSARSR
jgi:ribonuclease J